LFLHTKKKSCLMKNVVLLPVLTAFCLHINAQITVADYAKKINCAVDAVDMLEAPRTSSTCGPITTTIDDQIFSGGCLGTLVRNYTFTDQCGNKATADRYILLTDNDAPQLIGVPADLTINPVTQPVPPAAKVSASDNSGQRIDVMLTETRESDVITRTWTAEDPCGNKAEARQRIWLK
jgi:hypothetical protein